MKKRQLKKIVNTISREAPARFRYNAKVKRAWVEKMDRISSPYRARDMSGKSYHYDLDPKGNPIPCGLWQWAYLFEFQPMRRIVEQTYIPELENCMVSTVFLGTDHSWGHGPPITFESMVFRGPLDQEMQRYATREEALAGHKELVSRVLQLTATEESIS